MDLVDEEDLARFEIGEDGDHVARFFERRPGGLLHVRAHLVADDAGQRGLAEAGRAEEKDVIDRLLTPARRLQRDFEILFDLVLADVFAEELGS